MKKNVLLIALLFAGSSLFAQKDSLNAVIQVENDYNPVVTKVKKQSFVPRIEDTGNNPHLDLVFSQEATPFEEFVSERNVKEVLPKKDAEYPGYVRMGYGNDNNLDARIAYRHRFSEKDRFAVLAAMNGYKTELDGLERSWDSRFYNTRLSADYAHSFDFLTFGAKASFGNKVFNYQPFGDTWCIDKQNSMVFDVAFNLQSNLPGPFSYNAEAGYVINTRKYSNGGKKRISENHFKAKGTIAYELPNEDIQQLGATVAIDGFVYNGAMSPKDAEGYDDYMSIRFNPFMNFRFYDWKLRLGVHLDMLTANGTFMAFAPDCRLEGSISKSFQLYATATGGRTLNSFAAMEEVSPYWAYIPGMTEQLTASYKIFDVAAGGRISFEPFTTNIYLGYAYTKDDLLQTDVYNPNGLISTLFAQHNIHDFYVGMRFGYDYGGWFKFLADARYDRHTCSGYESWLMYKPQISVALDAEARLYDGLFLNLGYEFERYTKSDEEPIKGRIDNKNNLYARINCRFHERMGVFVRADNLLNSDYFIYPGYAAQGANFVAGAVISF